MCSSKLELLCVTLVALTVSACSTSKRLSASDAPLKAPPASAKAAPLTPQSVLTPIGLEVERPQKKRPFDMARAGFDVDLPRKWKTRRQDGALVYQGAMRVPTIVFFEAEGKTLDEAVAGVPAQLREVLGSLRVSGKAKRARDVAGYSARVLTGTGHAEGYPMRWRATVVDADRMTVIMVLSPSFIWGQASTAASKFVKSIEAY